MRRASDPATVGDALCPRRRAAARRAFLIAVLSTSVAGCSAGKPAATTIQVGHHRLRLEPPPGWEHLDHGREQLFRNGETQLRVADLGPATRQGLVSELREAQALWLAGRRGDALQRVRSLHGPPIRFLPWRERADFWKPWTDVTYVASTADSAELGLAFDALIRAAEDLPETPVAELTEYVLHRAHDADRREIGRRDSIEIHGSRWLVIETWDRLSHLYRRRVAILDHEGYLLELVTDRGVFEQMSGAFDSLLASIVVDPRP